jgi:coiled-coil and C2 domain-containing protein 2A
MIFVWRGQIKMCLFWLQEVIKLVCGGSCDHAVLLCCYLLGLDYKAWLGLGTGLAQGPSAYVITKESANTFRVWDPLSARTYPTTDIFCPLHKLNCLINDTNVSSLNSPLPNYFKALSFLEKNWST